MNRHRETVPDACPTCKVTAFTNGGSSLQFLDPLSLPFEIPTATCVAGQAKTRAFNLLSIASAGEKGPRNPFGEPVIGFTDVRRWLAGSGPFLFPVAHALVFT